MATRTVSVPQGNPVDISSGLSLTAGTEYAVQNVGPSDVLVAELVSAPDPAARFEGHLVKTEEWVSVRPTNTVYAQVPHYGSANLVATEA